MGSRECGNQGESVDRYNCELILCSRGIDYESMPPKLSKVTFTRSTYLLSGGKNE